MFTGVALGVVVAAATAGAAVHVAPAEDTGSVLCHLCPVLSVMLEGGPGRIGHKLKKTVVSGNPCRGRGHVHSDMGCTSCGRNLVLSSLGL